jgi:hypothetical protein
MRRLVWGALLILVVLVGAPSANALLVESTGFRGQIETTKIGGGGNASVDLAVTAGAIHAAGNATGLFSLSRVNSFHVANATRVGVYDLASRGTRIEETPWFAGQPPIFVGHDVAIDASDNASLVVQSPSTNLTFSIDAPFGFGVPLNPPERVQQGGIDVEVGPSFSIVGDASLAGSMTGDQVEWFISPQSNGTILRLVESGGGPTREYAGTNFLFHIVGRASFAASAGSTIVPFEGNVRVQVQPAPDATARNRFDPDGLNEAMASLAGNGSGSGPKIDPELASVLRSFSPLFNGALLGNSAGFLEVGSENRTLGSLTLLRFRSLLLSPTDTPTRVSLEGEGRFLLAGKSLYSDRASADVGPFRIPVFSLVLWVLAGVALVVAFVRPALLPAEPAGSSRPVRSASLLAYVGLAVIAFFLWDAEIYALLGSSFLSLLFTGEAGLALGLVLTLQLLAYGLAYSYFGLPIRYMVNSALKMASMKRARPLGKGLGHLAAWGLGAIHIQLMLDPFLAPLLSRLA